MLREANWRSAVVPLFFLQLVLLVVAGGIHAGFAREAGAPIFKNISPVTARTLLQQRQDIVLVDVRTVAENRRGTIAGSHLIPLRDVFAGRADSLKEKAVIMFCATGGRSYVTGRFLAAKGFKELYNMTGGIVAWQKAGFPVTR